MFIWIGVVSGILITSSFTSGLLSAVLDFTAFIIIMFLGVRRLKLNNERDNTRESQHKITKRAVEFKEEVKHINNESERIDITP